MADPEAIAEAAARPTMRFVAAEDAEKQAAGMVFKARDLLVQQETQTINALRGHLAEHSLVTPRGTAHLPRLRTALAEEGDNLPLAVVEVGGMLLAHIDALDMRIEELSARIRGDASSCWPTSRARSGAASLPRDLATCPRGRRPHRCPL